MFGLLTGIVVGVIAGAAAMVGATVSVAKYSNQTKRTASMQKKAVKGSLTGRKLQKALLKNYARQSTALLFKNKPLMERVNYFKYKVNVDRDFNKIWDKSITDKSWRKLGICKSKKKIAELKKRGVGKATKKIEKLQAKYGIGPMKEMGWTESKYITRSAGGGYVNHVAGFGRENADGTYEAGVDNEVRYQMIATCDDDWEYDPADIFQKSQDHYRKMTNDIGAKYTRFGIDYPRTAALGPDRFVVGCDSEWSCDDKIFQISKLVMIANACTKLVENPDVKKIRVIDESMKEKKYKVKIIQRKDFFEYIQKYIKGYGKSALKALSKIDEEQSDAIRDTLDNFAVSCGKSIEFGRTRRFGREA